MNMYQAPAEHGMGDYKKSESNAKTGVEIHQRYMLATAMLFRGAIRVALDRARSRSAGNACAVHAVLS